MLISKRTSSKFNCHKINNKTEIKLLNKFNRPTKLRAKNRQGKRKISMIDTLEKKYHTIFKSCLKFDFIRHVFIMSGRVPFITLFIVINNITFNNYQ